MLSRAKLAGAFACLPGLVVVLAGCGAGTGGSGAASKQAARIGGSSGAPLAAVGATPNSSRGSIKEVADPQEAASFPAPPSVHHAAASTPAKAGEAIVAAGAPSDAEVRRELQQMKAGDRSAEPARCRSRRPCRKSSRR